MQVLKTQMSLISLIKSFYSKKIILSGCISNGRDIASALQMGADIAYMGTRFINVKESRADEDYKKMIISSTAEDIVYTACVSGVHGNFLRPSLEAMGITEEFWKGSKKMILEMILPKQKLKHGRQYGQQVMVYLLLMIILL